MKRRLEFPPYPPHKRVHHEKERRDSFAERSSADPSFFSQGSKDRNREENTPKKDANNLNLCSSLFAALRENYQDSVYKFIEELPQNLNLADISILICATSRAANTSPQAFNVHKGALSQLLTKLGKELNKSLPDSKEELEVLIPQKEVNRRRMGLLLYSLGNLIRQDLESPIFFTKRLEALLNFIFLAPKSRINFIGSTIYGLGQLAEKGKIDLSFKADFLQTLVARYLELKYLNTKAITTTLIGLGSIVKTNKLEGRLNSRLLNSLMDKLATLPGLADPLSFGDCFLNLSILAKAKRLDKKISARTIDACLQKLLDNPLLDTQEHYIQKVLWGLGSLVKTGYLEGKLKTASIETLLKSKALLNSPQNENISLIFCALGWMKEASCFKTAFSPETLTVFPTLLKKFAESPITTTQAHQLLVGLIAFKIPISEDKLKRLFHSLLSVSYIHPSPAVDFLTKLCSFRELLPKLDQEFDVILDALLPLDNYNPHLQAILERIRIELEPLPKCRHALDRALNLIPQKDSRESIESHHSQNLIEAPGFDDEIEPRLSTSLEDSLNQTPDHLDKDRTQTPALTPEKPRPEKPRTDTRMPEFPSAGVISQRPREASSPRSNLSKRTSLPENQSLRKQRSRQSLTLTQSRRQEQRPLSPNPGITQKDWSDACNNDIFSSIANEDVSALQRLLRLKELKSSSQKKTLTQEKINTPKAKHLRQRQQNISREQDEIDSRVIDFFSKTKAQALKTLIQDSKPIYFFMLFNACSLHQRLQQAKLKRLHPVLLYLPAKYLEEMIKLMLSPLQFYRDHHALLYLIEALRIRAKKFKSDEKLLKNLQEKLLMACHSYHGIRKSHRVINTLIQVKSMLFSIKGSVLLGELIENEVNFAKEPTLIPSLMEPPSLNHRNLEPSTQEEYQSLNAPPERQPLVVNANYLYNTEDIQAILTARMSDYPKVHVLASAQMNDSIPGNKPSDVLSQALAANQELLNSEELNIFLLPIQRRNHWFGLRIVAISGGIIGIAYFNSLRGNHQLEINMLQENLNQAKLIPPTLKIIENESALKQTDASGCGPLLIENFYSREKGKWWADPGSSVSFEDMQKIRKRHLEILAKKRPQLYSSFYNKQRLNLNTVPSLREQSKTHGLSSLSLFSPRTQQSLNQEPIPNEEVNLIHSGSF